LNFSKLPDFIFWISLASNSDVKLQPWNADIKLNFAYRFDYLRFSQN